jgi:hypothetical protein
MLKNHLNTRRMIKLRATRSPIPQILNVALAVRVDAYRSWHVGSFCKSCIYLRTDQSNYEEA